MFDSDDYFTSFERLSIPVYNYLLLNTKIYAKRNSELRGLNGDKDLYFMKDLL